MLFTEKYTIIIYSPRLKFSVTFISINKSVYCNYLGVRFTSTDTCRSRVGPERSYRVNRK